MALTVAVIGGGAAGCIAAYFAKKGGANVVLFEKNEKLGKKMYITGKGRCNVTNDCDETEFLSNVVTNARFLTSAVYSFPPERLTEFLREGGLNIKTERGNRVFPLSDKSSDVIKCFQTYLNSAGVKIQLNAEVKGLVFEDCERAENAERSENVESGENSAGGVSDKTERAKKGEPLKRVVGVKTASGVVFADRVIVCTGGKSYPSTGSTGDGYAFALSAGHTVEQIRPALSGLELVGGHFAELSGLTLKNSGVKLFFNGKKIYEDFGELLFTHHGVSGPTVISASSYLSANAYKNGAFARKNGELTGYELVIDLKPALDEKTLDARVLRDFAEFKGKALKNSLGELLPKSLIGFIIRYCGLNGEKKISEITALERKKLVLALKNLSFKVKKLRPIEEAIVTGGGVSVKQVNPKTMQSKLVSGLYFAGEVLDIDALTGGFNLQCSFSTGYLAGENAAKE